MIPQALWLIITVFFKIVFSIIQILFFIIVLTYAYGFAKIATKELFDNRPIKFERYMLYGSIARHTFEQVINEQYKIGTNIDIMIDDLKKSGAKCYTEIWDEKRYGRKFEGAEYLIDCYYTPDQVYASPITLNSFSSQFSIDAIVDKHDKIIHLRAWMWADYF